MIYLAKERELDSWKENGVKEEEGMQLQARNGSSKKRKEVKYGKPNWWLEASPTGLMKNMNVRHPHVQQKALRWF